MNPRQVPETGHSSKHLKPLKINKINLKSDLNRENPQIKTKTLKRNQRTESEKRKPKNKIQKRKRGRQSSGIQKWKKSRRTHLNI